MAVGGSEIWRLATALSGAVTPLDVAVALAEEGASAAGATFSNMAVRDEGRTWAIHGAGLAAEAAERWSELRDDPATPLHDAIRQARPILLGSIEALEAAYPHLVADTVAAGLTATASLPLRMADGAAGGAAGFGWDTPQDFDDEQLLLLDLIAQMAASALERAALQQQNADIGRAREAEDAQLLQDVFLPRSLPKVEHLEAAARYLPAAAAPMGGDWYDVFPVEGGTCFVIGDVAGHDLAAASVMAQLRNAARAYAVEHPSPAEVVGNLNRMLCLLEPGETASVIVLTWDPALEVIVRTNAGHPPILRCRPGEFSFLQPEALGIILGVDPTWTYEAEVKQLRPGTTLLFYTDGLVEQRDVHLDESMEALRSFVEGLTDLSPQSVCDAVVEWRLERGPREDDLCVLAVRLD